MTESAVVHTQARDSHTAAREIADQVAAALPGEPPDALVLFASCRYDQAALLDSLMGTCRPKALVGASSAGEFTSASRGMGHACALALRSSEMRFAAGIGHHLTGDRRAAARALVSTFHDPGSSAGIHRSALIMTDALAGHADELIAELTLATSGTYQFFGGGAGDDGQFRHTNVFCSAEAVNDAVVGLEILSHKPLGIGVGHGWDAVGPGMRVTETRGTRLVSLNGFPAVEAFEEHARRTGQTLDRGVPSYFLLNNVLGVDTGNGEHRLRVPLAIHDDGSILCGAEIPAGVIVRLMKTSETSAVEAAARATRSAVQGLRGNPPRVALFFDCVATRLRMGDVFDAELHHVKSIIEPASLVGCNTHGQIARAEGQFCGFHNCTAVVCVFPE